MNITLQPEQEKFVQSQLTTGKYKTVDDIIAEALRLLEARNHQTQLLAEIHQRHWKPSHTVPDSVTLLRKMRGYDD
ncbi:MAG: type II toxin-antitoxin system ParD family antitoxin [Hormoscilla sp.]|nr:type II toxin-antitoxin system ParD family antitoxin [Hormoscilla sp. GUM202]